MRLIDTKTGDPWPSVMANLRLQEIRETCRTDLRLRDEGRGIVNGKLTDTIKAKDAGDDAATKDVVNAAKQAAAHTGDDLQRLLHARWATECSEPRDLQAFVARTRLPEKAELEAVTSAAAGVQESLNKELGSKPDESPEPKRGPGRPKKAEPVEA